MSHYGRHGSRYLISDNDYKWVIDRFHDAHAKGALTPLGRDVMQRLDSIWLEAEGRGGELTPLGARQHHDIATRMYQAYPEAFTNDARVTAASTQVMRCAHSMFAFVEGLKECNPSLVVPRESSQRNMYYLCYHSPRAINTPPTVALGDSNTTTTSTKTPTPRDSSHRSLVIPPMSSAGSTLSK